MNRVVTASIIAVLILISALAAFIYFNKYKSSSNTAFKAVPTDAAFVFTGKLNEEVVSSLLNSQFIKNFAELENIKKIQSRLSAFNRLATTDADFKTIIDNSALTISAHATKVDDYDFVFYLNNANKINETSLNQKLQQLFDTVTSVTIRNYEDVDVHDLKLKNNGIFTYAITADIFIASYTPFLVEDAIRQIKAGKSIATEESFKKLQLKDQPEGDFNIYFNYKNMPRWISTFCNQDGDVNFKNIETFADWSKLSITIKNSFCFLNGTTAVTDTASFVNLFAKQTPVELTAFTVMPQNAAVVKAYSISDKNTYFHKLTVYNSKFSNKATSLETLKLNGALSQLVYNEYGLLITEPGSTNYSNNTYAYFNATDIKQTKKDLSLLSTKIGDKKNQSKSKTDNYRNHQIISLPYENVVPDWLGKSFTNVTKFYFTDVKNFIFIGNSVSALKVLIDAYEDDKLLAQTPNYGLMKSNFPLAANYFYYTQVPECYYLLKSKSNNSWNTWLDDNRDIADRLDAYAFSIKNTNSLFETSAYLHTVEKVKDNVNVVWSAQLDYQFAIEPQVVETNNNTRFIAIQDTANQLYLIDNSGTVLWKKQLNEKIISTIYSLDIYKNGNRQLVFNTANNLWMLNFDSNAVSNYPIRLPSAASGSLSVIDYDNTLDYRMYIPCTNGQVYGYQPSGKPLPGFTFKVTDGLINEPMQYFKINTKDYLFANSSTGKVYVIDRMGKQTLTIQENIFKQTSTLFNLEKDSLGYKFTCIDTANNLVLIDSAGTVSRNASGLKNSYYPDVLNPYNIRVYESGIVVSDALKNQLFEYTAPEPISNKIISTTDSKGKPVFVFSNQQRDKIYIVNIKGKLLQGLPVKALSLPYVNDLNGDKSKKLITCGDSVSVTVYGF